ncbi:hypothetical protein BH23GEM1_BH23GEM1_00540 [soil metagenome]
MEAVCERIAQGELVKDAAPAEGTTAKTVREWAASDEFGALYARARVAQAHTLAEEIIAVSDAALGMSSEGVNAQRLRVDSRKWLASKIAPRTYGDKIEVEGEMTVSGVQVFIDGGPTGLEVPKTGKRQHDQART